MSAAGPRAGSWSWNKQHGGLRDGLNTRSSHNSTPMTTGELDNKASRPSFSDAEDDEDVEMEGLEEIAMTPLKATHPVDNDSESSDDEDDAGRGLLASGSGRRPGHAHKRSLSLSKGIDIWQQVKNIVIEVSGYPPAPHRNTSYPIDCAYTLVHNGRYHIHRRVDENGPREHPS